MKMIANRTRSLFAMLALALTFGLTAHGNESVQRAMTAETAEEAVQIATDEVLALISAGQSYAEEEPERFYAEVESLLAPMIDFKRFSRNVMGVYARDASEVQRERFADSFKWSLVRTYALALTQFTDGEVRVLPPRRKPRDPNKVNVSMEIEYRGSVFSIVYQMRRRNSVWQLNNMVIEGVNIGLNFKSQFKSAMSDPEMDGDLDRVIEAWGGIIDSTSEDGEDNAAAGDAEGDAG